MNLDDVFAHLDPQERYDAASILRQEIRRRRASAEATAAEPKWCPTCKQSKPRREFGRNAARPDGLQSVCRACR